MSSGNGQSADFVSVPVGKIEQELANQLKAEQDQDGPPIHRARMSNLVIYCDQQEQVDTASSALSEIVAVHPSRVLLLLAEAAKPDKEIEASVRLRTRYVNGSRQEVGSEQVRLHATGRSVEHLPYIVRGLLIGDLPTNVWWVSQQPPPLAGPLLYDLTEYAEQIIYDSFGWLEPHRGVSATAAWLARFERDGGQGRWRVASDLNWRRLKTWRRLMAQALDPSTAPGALGSIREVQIEHGPHAVTQAWELASWFGSRLGWRVKAGRFDPGVEIAWQIETPHGPVRLRIDRHAEGPQVIERVRIACEIEGQPTALNLVNEDQKRLSVIPEGQNVASRTMTLKTSSLAELVGRQLTDRERDPVFSEAMAIAQVLAQGLSR